MATRMLIDATHAEETRVVVLKGNRIEEFDFETSTKQVLKGNIYLAKVTRVEPSLQAAFVDFGGNRHGFLAFGEIHPDYYQIPIADREALLRELEAEEQAIEAEEDALAEAEAAAEALGGEGAIALAESVGLSSGLTIEGPAPDLEDTVRIEDAAGIDTLMGVPQLMAEEILPAEAMIEDVAPLDDAEAAYPSDSMADAEEDFLDEAEGEDEIDEGAEDATSEDVAAEAAPVRRGRRGRRRDQQPDPEERRRSRRARLLRQYKIQEVIKRRQIMLVQVVKEERGNKGAALTTYLSLAGRYCVLMPNTARGGGISRKIVSPADRKRLKEIAHQVDVPQGMGMIIRTAGMERSLPEIKRDFEYLMRSWDGIRELTMRSTAPCLIYEEANLIKRAIRDLYNQGIEEVQVEGQDGFQAARDFMTMLMPGHDNRVKLYQDRIPLFQRYQVESQLDAIFSNTVQLRSGGYIVINPTEALVAIDVNSGRSTREHHIEETALKTNLEAAEEIARQLRLRDLAGLIVTDFIDMSDGRANRAVERRMKECLRNDRARIQVGRISPFGLLEMSRQRLRPSVLESSSQACPHCNGTGFIRSIESSALHLLHAIEEEAVRGRTVEINVAVATKVAMYLLNNKRRQLQGFEEHYNLRVTVTADDSLIPPEYRLDRVKAQAVDVNRPEPVRASPAFAIEMTPDEDSAAFEPDMADDALVADEQVNGNGNNEERNGRRRRRRRGRRDERGERSDPIAGVPFAAPSPFQVDHLALELGAEARPIAGFDDTTDGDDEDMLPEGAATGSAEQQNRRRRGRRGGRRRNRDRFGQDSAPQDGTNIPIQESAITTERATGEISYAPAASAPQPSAPALTGETSAPTALDDPNAKPRLGWWRRKLIGS